jgi:hypothetical protein
MSYTPHDSEALCYLNESNAAQQVALSPRPAGCSVVGLVASDSWEESTSVTWLGSFARKTEMRLEKVTTTVLFRAEMGLVLVPFDWRAQKVSGYSIFSSDGSLVGFLVAAFSHRLCHCTGSRLHQALQIGFLPCCGCGWSVSF